jgi:hypothetical protein
MRIADTGRRHAWRARSTNTTAFLVLVDEQVDQITLLRISTFFLGSIFTDRGHYVPTYLPQIMYQHETAGKYSKTHGIGSRMCDAMRWGQSNVQAERLTALQRADQGHM